jgi:hypothetical protein
MIEGTELEEYGCIDTAASSRLSPQQSRDLLCNLLKLHDPPYDVDDVARLSGLECGVIEDTGCHVWATRAEMDRFGDHIIPVYNAPACDVPGVLPPSVFRFFVIIHRVRGVRDITGKKIRLKWQSIEGGVQVLSGVLPPPQDVAREPEWDGTTKRMVCTRTLEALRQMQLRVLIQRRRTSRLFVYR